MKYLYLLIFLPIFSFSQVQIGQDIDGEAEGDSFGDTLSLSADGTVVAIGAPSNDSNGDRSGQVRIFKNILGNWIQIGDDIDGEVGDGDDNFFSKRSVSLSADGSIVAIGVPFNDDNGESSGQVRIFENISGVWTQIGDDINGYMNSDDHLLGYYLSISGDGSIVAIGSPYVNFNILSNTGYVRVFKNISGDWTQVGSDFRRAGYDGLFSSTLSNNGNRLAITYALANGSSQTNTIRIYENQAGIWTLLGNNIVGETHDSKFGSSLSLSANGNIIAIGRSGFGVENGYVRIYEYLSGIWTQIGTDIESESIDDETGSSVSLSSDGSIIAVGAASTSENAQNSGQARIYKFRSGNWIKVGSGINGEAEYDNFGLSISLSADGNIVAVGSPFNSGNGQSSGHVRVFDLTEVLSTEEETLTSFKLYPNPTKNHVTIQLETGLFLETATIYNTLGQIVLIATETTINTSKLSSGTYVIEIKTNKGKSAKKLIIE